MIFLKTILFALLSALLLFIITKVLGNKQISELNTFDYINGITIGSIAAEMSTVNTWSEVGSTAIAMLVYGAVGLTLSILSMKFITCRRFLSGKTLILIDNGKIFSKNLKKAKLDVNELLTKARINGFFNIADISFAALENNGEISFLPVSTARPVNLSDLGITPESAEHPQINVIIDGKILHRNLRYSGNDETWLRRRLNEQKINSESDVFLATVDSDNKLTAYLKNDNENDSDFFS